MEKSNKIATLSLAITILFCHCEANLFAVAIYFFWIRLPRRWKAPRNDISTLIATFLNKNPSQALYNMRYIYDVLFQ